jgi:hypothetical protein
MNYRFSLIETMNNGFPDGYRFPIFISHEPIGDDIDIVEKPVLILETIIDAIISQTASRENQKRNIVIFEEIEKLLISRPELNYLGFHRLSDNISGQSSS